MFKEIEEDTFPEGTESSMAAVVTEVDPREDLSRNWLLHPVACFDCNLQHLEITCPIFFAIVTSFLLRMCRE